MQPAAREAGALGLGDRFVRSASGVVGGSRCRFRFALVAAASAELRLNGADAAQTLYLRPSRQMSLSELRCP
jgi:hypothetical protein